MCSLTNLQLKHCVNRRACAYICVFVFSSAPANACVCVIRIFVASFSTLINNCYILRFISCVKSPHLLVWPHTSLSQHTSTFFFSWCCTHTHDYRASYFLVLDLHTVAHAPVADDKCLYPTIQRSIRGCWMLCARISWLSLSKNSSYFNNIR